VEVQFLPDIEKQTAGPRSTAVTDDQGHYTLYFDDDQPGAVVGYHRVLIVETDDGAPRGRKGEGHRARAIPQTVAHTIVPDQYKKAATTPLKTEIREGTQVINFDLP
jgi:hypothetical protein